MEKKLHFWLVGGDLRQAALARALRADGHEVHTYALEEAADSSLQAESLTGIQAAHCVVLPLPAANGELVNAPLSQKNPTLEEVLTALNPGQLLCAGMPSQALAEAAQRQGITLVDYFAREELAVSNAIPGALAV